MRVMSQIYLYNSEWCVCFYWSNIFISLIYIYIYIYIFFFFFLIKFYVPFKIISAHMRRANQQVGENPEKKKTPGTPASRTY